MENLERLASSVAQIELLVASLKRENRDLSGRLAQAAVERREAQQALEAQEQRHDLALSEARSQALPDPQWESRALKAEAEALELGQRLERSEVDLRGLREQGEGQGVELREAHKAQLAERENRITRLESECLDLGRQLNEAHLKVAEAANPDEVARWQEKLRELEGYQARAAEIEAQGARLAEERSDLRVRRRELAAYSKERDNLKRRVQELLATLESVRLG